MTIVLTSTISHHPTSFFSETTKLTRLFSPERLERGQADSTPTECSLRPHFQGPPLNEALSPWSPTHTAVGSLRTQRTGFVCFPACSRAHSTRPTAPTPDHGCLPRTTLRQTPLRQTRGLGHRSRAPPAWTDSASTLLPPSPPPPPTVASSQGPSGRWFT